MIASTSGPTARRRLARAVGAVVLLGLLAGCGGTAEPAGGPPPSVPTDESSSATSAAPDPGPVPSARVGKPGQNERVTFVPESLTLPGGDRAPVQPAPTVDGQLQVPENVDHVGWWDGSASAGDPFGRIVIAGHVDSASGASGFFARLKRMKVGDVVTLRGDDHRLRYRISAVQVVARHALATDGQAFDQSGPHRLVLITCTGTYRRDRGGYESNLVVVGEPLGSAR